MKQITIWARKGTAICDKKKPLLSYQSKIIDMNSLIIKMGWIPVNFHLDIRNLNQDICPYIYPSTTLKHVVVVGKISNQLYFGLLHLAHNLPQSDNGCKNGQSCCSHRHVHITEGGWGLQRLVLDDAGKLMFLFCNWDPQRDKKIVVP